VNAVIIARPLLHELLGALLRGDRTTILSSVGVARWQGNAELLVRSVDGGGPLLVWSGADDLSPPRALPEDCLGVLLVGRGALRGQAAGFIRAGHAIEPVHVLKVVGAGMHTCELHRQTPARPDITAALAPPASRWSRTIGALGLGVWTRLTRLRYGIVGLGRTGSIVAHMLARLGVRHLTLVDPDTVERHNLGEMTGITESAIGFAKVDALGAALARGRGAVPEVLRIRNSITHLRSLHAAQACDVLFACVDHDAARLALAAIATLYSRLLIDIGAGVHGHGAERVMGADVRLVLPGRCLLCMGGLRDEDAARRVLASPQAERTFYAGRDWQAERAGSLHSLNQLSAAIALRLLEDLVAERIRDSVWAHLEFDAHGRLSVSYPSPAPADGSQPCPMCRWSASGDDGLAHIASVLLRNSDPSPTRDTTGESVGA